MNSAVDSLLLRLKLPELIPKFKEMKLDRIINLRKLNEEELREVVPDAEQRRQIIQAITNRGTHEKKPQPQAASMNPLRNADDGGRGGISFPRGGLRGGSGGGRGGGSRGGRGGGGGGSTNNDGSDHHQHHHQFPTRQRPCDHFFENRCKYGDKCRYAHDKALYQKELTEGRLRRQNDISSNSKDHCVVCEIPTQRIKYLLAHKAERLRQIHALNKTHNEFFDWVDQSVEKFELKVYGADLQSVLQSKKMILACVGVTRAEEQKNRLEYAINELSSNQRSAKLIAACNIKNKGTSRELSEAALKNIISFFRFEKPQDIRHFYVNTPQERSKLEMVAKVVAELQGVQAIMFCDQKRVMELSKVASKITRFFNGVTPLFIHRGLSREERMSILERFKNGEENESGIRERLLVTNEDYAKLARKTIIPYVNLVINYSVPRTEEFYLLQSLVAGRSGSVGISILCVNVYEQTMFNALQQKISFKPLDDETSIRETAVQLVYDTTANPLTSKDADPPKDWKEKLNQKKEGSS